jgi:hypothetical protein
MAALHSYETYETTEHSMRRNISKVLNLQQNRCENLKTPTTSLVCNKVGLLNYRRTNPGRQVTRVTRLCTVVESSWNVMAQGDTREGKWRGNWRMQWVASTLTLPRNMVYPPLLPLMRTTRLPVFDWTDTPADLNGLVRFAERRNLVSALVPSHFKPSLPNICGSSVWYWLYVTLLAPRISGCS